MNAVKIKTAEKVDIDFAEAARYLGCRVHNSEVYALIAECAKQFKPAYRACYAKFSKTALDFKSRDLEKVLIDCDEVFLFAATVGVEADRLVSRYMSSAPSKAVVADALATAAVEAWCDMLFEDENVFLTRRYSPGYGDLALDFQKVIFAELNCAKNAGIYLTDALTMLPMKSVSGIVGICKTPQCKNSCDSCTAKNCEYRR